MSPVQVQRIEKEQFLSELLYGSPNWARTSDIMINSHALYRLSYRGILTAFAAARIIIAHIFLLVNYFLKNIFIFF